MIINQKIVRVFENIKRMIFFTNRTINEKKEEL